MRHSARLTERLARRGGYTLLEVMIALAIFVFVLALVLQQLDESIRVSSLATVQADLRRIGQDCLSRIVNDLRSTQARMTGVYPGDAWGRPYLGDRIEFMRVLGFDPVLQTPTIERIGQEPVYTEYLSTSFNRTNDQIESRRNNILELWRYTKGHDNATGPVAQLTRELAPDGFVVKASNQMIPFVEVSTGKLVTEAFAPSFGSGDGNLLGEPWNIAGMALPGVPSLGKQFRDEPVVLSIQLVLRRRIGWGPQGDIYAVVHVETSVSLKESAVHLRPTPPQASSGPSSDPTPSPHPPVPQSTQTPWPPKSHR